jgi:hypothetical protein
MDLISRVQGILLKPKDEWIKIKEEKTTIVQLFTTYACILAAIPAIFRFIGQGLIGRHIPFVNRWIRMDIGSAIIDAVLYYVLILGSIYLTGIIINALAPSFGSAQNQINAMKLAVYSMTPAFIAGIFFIFIPLWILCWLASLYGLFVLYLGFATPMMDTPKDKAVTYFVVTLAVMIVLNVVIGIVLGAIFSFGAVTGAL